MNIEFEKSDQGYVAEFTAEGEFAIQVIFPEGVSATVKASRSLDGEHFDPVGVSRISPCPIIQSTGCNEGDYIRLESLKEPESVIYKSLE